MEKKLNQILELYAGKRSEIKKRLEEFRTMFDKSDEKLFSELAFCILTPQSKAKTAWNIIKKLEENNLLFNGTEDQIKPFLNPIRFNNVKAKRLVVNRNFFSKNGKIKIKDKLLELSENPVLLREWLVENIEGYGMKEASHFIRNIGVSKNQLAILDVHILKNLKELGVIDDDTKIPSTKKKYLEIEIGMKEFSNKIGISMDELDILLWSKETGIIFK